MTETILEIKHLKKSYGENQVLKDISLTIHQGEVNISSFNQSARKAKRR